MKRLILASVVSIALAVTAHAEDAPTVSITTEYLGTLKISLGKPQMVGTHIIFEAKECTLEGPNIKAVCVSPSADWQTGMPDGSLRLDIRAMLKTEDKKLIFLEGSGIRFGGYDVLTLRYTTDAESLAWLNNIQSVAKRVSSGAEAGFDIFIVR
jgi:Protein of unknown function (DUF3237)